MKKILLLFLMMTLLLAITGCQTTESGANNENQQSFPTSQTGDQAEEPLSREVEITLTDAYPHLSFRQPLEYLHAGDGSDRVFVVEKGGRILVFPNDPQVREAQVFLDLTDLVDANASEKGLLGLAFHPQYRNGFFYVNYTTEKDTVIARYQTDPNNPHRGLADSGQIILSFPQPYANHNGGHMAFGEDGFLYIATGDGGSKGDPQNNAQNLSNLLGKILRIDVDRPGAGKHYGIPADNPFAGNTQGFREEIFAYGLRNPWKFSFDRQGGRLWAADVGQDKVEEINLIEKGKNYGWNLMEASRYYSAREDVTQEGLVLPVWEYEHQLGKSITGGAVYYGDDILALKGAYIYGDFVSGRIWALWLDNDLKVDNRQLLDTELRISSFGVDGNNEIYVVDYQGKIYKLVPKSD